MTENESEPPVTIPADESDYEQQQRSDGPTIAPPVSFANELGRSLLGMIGSVLFMLRGAAGFFAVAAPILLVGYQSYAWLRFGAWPRLNIVWALDQLGVSRPYVDWVGLQQVIDLLLAGPLSVTALVLGIVIASLAELCLSHVPYEHQP